MASKRSINRVFLVGTTGREPEITHIPSLGKDVAKFSMVTTELYMDKGSNEWKELPEWHNIVAWGWNVKKIEKYIHKGSLVLVEGRIKTRKWKDKNDQDRWTTEIHADTVVPLDKTQKEGSFAPGENTGYSGGYNAPSQQRGGSGGPGPEFYDQAPYPPEMQINDLQYDEVDDPF